jgi:hypothetical protein
VAVRIALPCGLVYAFGIIVVPTTGKTIRLVFLTIIWRMKADFLPVNFFSAAAVVLLLLTW